MAEMFSLEAEMAVLGGLFVSPVAFADVAAIIKPASFGNHVNRLIFEAMALLAAKNVPLDLVTVSERLESAGQIPDPVDFGYLVSLARETPSAANVLAYAAVIRRHAQRRYLVKLGQSLSQWATETADAEQVITRLQQAVAGLDSQRGGGPQIIADLLPDVIKRLDERSRRAPGTRLGLETGLGAVDDQLDGLCPGRLYVVAGRPGMGKSIFGLQSLRAAVAAGLHALLFTLEMPADETIHRLLAAEMPLNFGKLQAGRLTEDDWDGLTSTVCRLSPAKLWIDDSSEIGIADLLARARRLHRRNPLGLVVVDYLSLVTGIAAERRDLEVGSITRLLKALAKELNCPVVLLAQLNRKLEDRANKRPQMADLRESGSVEQDADVVLFLYRDEIYNPETPDKGCAELIIGKNRGGPTGMIGLRFEGQHSRFLPLDGGLPSANAAAEPKPKGKKYSGGLDQ